jgi:hypothetical protein
MKCAECLFAVVAMMLAVAGLDLLCGPQVNPWLAYAIPVALASRYCSFIVGAAYALMAGALVCVVGRNSGHAFTSDAFFFVAVSWQVLALTLIAWLVSQLSIAQVALRKSRAERRSA